jgi:tight adherence protein C
VGGDPQDDADRAVIDPALTGLAATCCVGVAMRGVVLMRSPSAVERRELSAELADRSGRHGPTRQLIDLLGARLGPRMLARISPSRREAVIRRLDRAGRPGGIDLERYAELRAALLAISVALAIFSVALGMLLLAPAWIALGLLGVDFWLSRVGRRRQERLERDIPDFIDIVSITVRAGTGYRAALERVSSSLAGPPAEEILLTLRQMDLGATRREAFQQLRERNNSPTLDSFVAAQLQAEELGVPLADALASIASDTRRAAAQAARRRAQRAVPRVSLITAVLLLPATMLLIGVGMYIGQLSTVSHLFG